MTFRLLYLIHSINYLDVNLSPQKVRKRKVAKQQRKRSVWKPLVRILNMKLFSRSSTCRIIVIPFRQSRTALFLPFRRHKRLPKVYASWSEQLVVSPFRRL